MNGQLRDGKHGLLENADWAKALWTMKARRIYENEFVLSSISAQVGNDGSLSLM
ncbi:MAG TPA: hypothetical protein VF528_03490 [Pyrinomonadaceae bacterium]